MKKNISKIIIAVLVVIAVVEGAFLYRAYVIPSDTMRIARKISRMEKTIEKKYTGGKVDKDKLEDYAYKGFILGLGDAYSAYYNEDEFKELTSQSSGTFEGVGLEMSQVENTQKILVLRVIKGTPSEKKGIKKGDILTKIDGKSVDGKSLSDVVLSVRGKKGTKVKLTFLRDSKNYTVNITRDEIETPTVDYKMLDSKIGYIDISEFDEVTVKQFETALKSLKKQGMKSLILDVRDNPGGLLDVVTDVADQLQDKGTIVSIKDKEGNTKTYKAKSNEKIDVPMCLLVNENSASAAEILAGTLKDNKIATLVGSKTFGKGIVQGFYGVGNGDYLKLTFATYYTPNGHNIHKKGIKPNVVVKDNTKTSKDEVLEKAEQMLK